MDLELWPQLRGRKKSLWQQLLTQAGLTAEELPEQTALLWDGDTLAATGSRQGNLLKYLAVNDAYRGEGLLSTVLTALRQEAFRQGYQHLFLYTKPQNAQLFEQLLFYPVASTDNVLLMEDRRDGIQSFLNGLPVMAEEAGAAVMNCDPFTLGHRYLIEEAAKRCKHLYVFVLSEDRGCFSAADRLHMVKAGTEDLDNVTVLPTGPYLISAATFPTYFLKDRDAAGQVQCQLDVAVFTRYFAPKFRIVHRFVGTEPLSAMTAGYNRILQKLLPEAGIRVTEIPRLEVDGEPVSASKVRQALSQKDWETVKNLVPRTTLQHLQKLSQEGSL